ncbi:MAG: YkvA family protein [Dermatophilaceae bacterium]
MSRSSRLASASAVFRAVRLATRPGGPSIGERVGALPRLVRATLRREYTGTSNGRLAMALVALGYLVSPVDLVPEVLLGPLGLADDALVVGWLATLFVDETESYLAWERSRPVGDDTVQGHVVD